MRAEPMIEGLVCRSGWESGIVKAVQENSTKKYQPSLSGNSQNASLIGSL